MMNNFAYLKPESPFYDLFPPRGEVPIRNIIVPNLVDLDGDREREVYMVDLDKCSEEKVQQICARIADRANMPESVRPIYDEVRRIGLPLRASQVQTVTTDCPFFL
jgi:hypothetical protein